MICSSVKRLRFMLWSSSWATANFNWVNPWGKVNMTAPPPLFVVREECGLAWETSRIGLDIVFDFAGKRGCWTSLSCVLGFCPWAIGHSLTVLSTLGNAMSKPRDDRQKDLLLPALDQIIDMGHPLVRLAGLIDYSDSPGVPHRSGSLYCRRGSPCRSSRSGFSFPARDRSSAPRPFIVRLVAKQRLEAICTLQAQLERQACPHYLPPTSEAVAGIADSGLFREGGAETMRHSQ